MACGFVLPDIMDGPSNTTIIILSFPYLQAGRSLSNKPFSIVIGDLSKVIRVYFHLPNTRLSRPPTLRFSCFRFSLISIEMYEKSDPRLSRIREFEAPRLLFGMFFTKSPNFHRIFQSKQYDREKTWHNDQLQLYQKIDLMTDKISDS